MSLRHFRAFTAVAESGSFTEAASRLALSQSALTATIQQLESAVGLQLFNRTTRKVELTAEAIWFKDVAEQVLRQFENALADLKAIADGNRGEVRIAAAPSMIEHVVAPTLAVFRRSYPGVTIVIIEGGSDRVEHMVRNGEVDFGISSPLNDFPDLDYVPILDDPFGVVYGKDHPLSAKRGKGEPLTWKDLEGFDLIALTKDTGITDLLERYPDLDFTHRTEKADKASSTTVLYPLLGVGDKISILPMLAARTGNLTEFNFQLLTKPEISREICLITRHQRSSTPNAQRMLDALSEVISQSEELRAAIPAAPRLGKNKV